MSLDALVSANVFAFLLCLVRIAGFMMVLPGFAENYVPVRVRLVFSFAMAVIVTPLVSDSLPPQPHSPMGLAGLFMMELTIALLIGLSSRIILFSLHLAGSIIAMMSGLGFVTQVDPGQGIQGAMVASFFSFLAILIIFATDMHHMMLRAVVDSYVLFPVGEVPSTGDLGAYAAELITTLFRIGTQIAGPFIAYGLITYTVMGLMNRMMPQLPIFMLLMPLQILLAFMVIGLVLPAIMQVFFTEYEQHWSQFLVPR